MTGVPLDEDFLRFAWSRYPLSYICEMANCGRRKVYYYARKFGLGPKPEGTYLPRRGRKMPDPTPDQIRQRCLEVQARWSPAERERRAGRSKLSAAAKAMGYDGRSVRFSERLL